MSADDQTEILANDIGDRYRQTGAMVARGPSKFSQAAVTRAIKGALAAGVSVARVEIDKAGNIKIIVGDKDEPAESENTWEGVG